MRKLLLILAPAALLLTSCLKSSDPAPQQPPEVFFYLNFLTIQNHGMALTSMVDNLIDKHQAGDIVSEMTVVDQGGSTFLLTINCDNMEQGGYSAYRGEIKVTVANSGTELTNTNTSKTIDVSKLKFIDQGRSYSYGGSINVANNIDSGDPDIRIEEIDYINFSISEEGAEKTIWSINFTFVYEHKGVSTISNLADDTHTWQAGGYGTGSHVSYGDFTVGINLDIVKEQSLTYVSSGKYTFYVNGLGNGITPITAEYGKKGVGTIVITYNNVETTV